MRILVCGSRDWADKHAIAAMLLPYKDDPETVIVHGNQRGADRLAADIAARWHFRAEPFDAEWMRLGQAAGPIRNQRMIDEGHPDLCLAFPLPGSRGTWDMVRRCEVAGIPVQIYGQLV